MSLEMGPRPVVFSGINSTVPSMKNPAAQRSAPGNQSRRAGQGFGSTEAEGIQLQKIPLAPFFDPFALGYSRNPSGLKST